MSELNWADMHKDATTALVGDFPVVIVETESKKTNDGTKDMIKFKAKVESGQYVGRTVFGQFTVSPESPAAMRMLFTHLAALGLDGAYFAQNPTAPVAQIARDLQGRSAIVTLGTRQWQGVDRENIEGWKPKTLGVGGALGGTLAASTAVPADTPAVPAGQPLSAATPPAEATPAAATAEPSTAAPELPF